MIKLSTRGRYGTRVLLDLALRQTKGEPIPLKEIAQRQEISLQYLEHLITPLIAAGMVKSSRGARGGVQLAKPPCEIELIEVVETLEGSIVPVDCIDSPEVCPRSKLCATRDIWAEVKEAIDKVLKSTTLQDLVECQKKKEQSGKSTYYI